MLCIEKLSHKVLRVRLYFVVCMVLVRSRYGSTNTDAASVEYTQKSSAFAAGAAVGRVVYVSRASAFCFSVQFFSVVVKEA